MLLELLEVQVKKPGQAIVATGPFRAVPNSTTELLANADYYGGTPHISEIKFNTFPSVRTAWAELLRNRIDMLHEVGPEALDSLETSTSIAVFKFTQRYQYIVALNAEAPALRSSAIRRALNLAIDRTRLVRQALNQHGVPSSGPLWPKYWALENAAPSFEFDPQRAAAILASKRVRFTCLIPSDQIYERIALELKRQLAAVGVDMNVRATSQDELFEAEKNRKYEAVLVQAISGPTLLRLYQAWHSDGAANMGGFGNRGVDAAFDRARHAETEQAYRQAVTALQQAFSDDPPAIFLAWLERARAVSKRFVVPPSEPGRDIVGTLRLWTPRNDERIANRN
jgi:ABC-type transport system substrate-binding protein